jgi:hypothetical protein
MTGDQTPPTPGGAPQGTPGYGYPRGYYPEGYQGPGPGGYPLPVRKFPLWKTAAIVAGCLFAIILVFVLLGVVYLATAKEVPATVADMQYALKAEEVADWMDWYEATPGAETALRRTFLDRTYEIEYEYDSDGLYVFSLYLHDSDHGNASIAYSATEASWKFPGGHYERKEGPALDWGSRSASYVLLDDGEPVGNYFIGQHGVKVLEVMIIGVYFDVGDAEAFEQLMRPVLQRIASSDSNSP